MEKTKFLRISFVIGFFAVLPAIPTPAETQNCIELGGRCGTGSKGSCCNGLWCEPNKDGWYVCNEGKGAGEPCDSGLQCQSRVCNDTKWPWVCEAPR